MDYIVQEQLLTTLLNLHLAYEKSGSEKTKNSAKNIARELFVSGRRDKLVEYWINKD